MNEFFRHVMHPFPVAVSSAPGGSFMEGLPEHAWIVGLAYAVLIVIGLVVNVALAIRFFFRPIRWSERVQSLEQRPWSSGEAMRLLLFLTLLYVLVSLAQHVLGGDTESLGVIWVVLQSLLFHVAGLAYVVASLRRQRLSWSETFGLDSGRIGGQVGTAVLLYLAMLPLLWFYTMLYQVGLRSAGYEPLPQEVVTVFASESSLWLRAYMVLLAAVVAPLFEEVLFRGIALPVLARQRGVTGAVVIMAVVFAAIHFHVPSLVPLFIVAVAFSIGYIYSGSLLVPVVMHGLFNTVNLVLLAVLRPSG